jgi:thiamine biosynthesis lipoprotein
VNLANDARDAYVHTVAMMGTVVTIHVVGHGKDDSERRERADGVTRAVEWFRRIEDCCTRFDPHSEVRQLTAHIGSPIAVSDILLEAVQFALAVAEESAGAFDPTVGRRMEERGFDREYRTGQVVRTPLESDGEVSFRDVHVDKDRRTITLGRPLLLDLGAVAKGLAIDMAVRELQAFKDFAVDAGGDLYLAGHNAAGEPWSVGIRHPREHQQLIGTLHVSDMAVCTSGDYERTGSPPHGEPGHHILDARTGKPTTGAATATVLAQSAMVADALGTAAFILGPSEGIALLERHDVDGLIVTPALDRFATRGMRTTYLGAREAASGRS